MGKEEKVLILAALFHDIGKFEQRCTNRRVKHQELGAKLVNELEESFKKIVGDGIEELKSLVLDHHNREKSGRLLDIIKTADHLSASERVGFDEEDEWKDKWSHKYLSSLFSKISLNNIEGKNQRYYCHKTLNKKDYKILIPEFNNEKDLTETGYTYTEKEWNNFKRQLITVLDFYNDDADFDSLINLLLILFEKYMWCIPDFTGSSNTDISLYNHLKDVCGIAHAIYKAENENNSLNLIIGDLPGIQKYIFNVTYKKPAKVLRGRSIFVQILTRQFATIILKELGLTETNLIMLAGGKFYILSQDSDDFEQKYSNAVKKIEDYLIENFNYQLSFSTANESFNYNLLMEKDIEKRITFGEIIDKASYKLLLRRNQQFNSVLFDKQNFDENNFVLPSDYIKPNEDGNTNTIKDAVTGLPIREGRGKELKDGDKGNFIDFQVFNEIKIGTEAPQSNVVILFDDTYSKVSDIKKLNDYKPKQNDFKILLNPNLDELLSKENIKKDMLRNTQLIEVANYSAWDKEKNHVMEFEQLEKVNNGAELLTIIKGDVDNLGLIMSSGLFNENDDLRAISRTTTLSNHLRYFFSFTLNGFLRDWEEDKFKKNIDDNYSDDQKIYTIFAGGDDIMLVSPHSSSLKLLNEFNHTFNDFVCENPEVHISYSLTNFKHGTPIRLVADMAEENQNKIKDDFKGIEIHLLIKNDTKIFQGKNDKAGFRVFNTNIKNDDIEKLLKKKLDLITWERQENNRVTKGVLRNLMYFSKIMKDFEETNDAKFLMWHPKLNYMINRLLKNKKGEYYNNEVQEFFDSALKINKKNSVQDEELGKLLYPIVCEAIYGSRNLKGV